MSAVPTEVAVETAPLAANKYGQPILGLIFLRYADILFKQHKEEIETEIIIWRFLINQIPEYVTSRLYFLICS